MPRIVLTDLDGEQTHSCADVDAVIGRDPACGFPIEGPKSTVVSGHHARIFFQDNAWWIQDVSRNGTVLDSERLIKGERHALREGQLIGLGETGPRLRVTTLDARTVSRSVSEPGVAGSPVTQQNAAARRPRPAVPFAATPVAQDMPATAPRKPGGLRLEVPTEPMGPAPDWVVHVVLRLTQTKQRYDVRGDVVTVGRSPECMVQVSAELGAAVSRIHAEVAIQEGGVVVRDAHSRNGTFVNGKRIEEPQAAKRGDVIMLGPGGPTLTIEDLHIVKAAQPSPMMAGGGALGSPARSASYLAEPRTDPPAGKQSLLARAMTPAKNLMRRGFGDRSVGDAQMSRKRAHRLRVILWSAAAAVAIALGLLWASGRV